MDGFLFPPEEYTDERIRAIMDGHTCRQCANRFKDCGGYASYCWAKGDRRTKNKHLKVKANQPACILFSHKDNAR